MIRFAIFLVLFIALIAVIIYYKDKLGARLYKLLIACIIFIFCLTFLYASIDNSSAVFKNDLIIKFNSGENIECKNLVINIKEYNYSNGTQVFLHKTNNTKIKLEDCLK